MLKAKMPRPLQDTLPPRLEALLGHITHRELADRLERVYRAAALAIDRLSHLNIVKYEPTSVQEAGADLSLWETMAPVLRDTVVDVNALVSAIQEAFPPSEQRGTDGAWTPPPASADERLDQEVEIVLGACAARLAQRVAELGQRVRQPEVVSDRWELMAELQTFRADFRARIGDLVYLTAAAFESVMREEVVPGHPLQMAAAAALRGAVTDLRRALQSRMEKFEGLAPGEVPAQAQRLEETLAAFAGMNASLTLKTRDKRLLVAAREQLTEWGSRPALDAAEVQRLMRPLVEALEQVSAELTKYTLTAHDRAVRAECGAKLEQATLHLLLGSPGAERAVREASATAEALYGRSPTFDAALRKVRLILDQSFDDAQLRETLELFRENLASRVFT